MLSLKNVICVVVLLAGMAGSASAQWIRAGRDLENGRDFNLRLTGGSITEFQAMVQETTRRVYEVAGEDWKQDRANRFDLNDFNVTGSHTTLGLSMEKAWKYLTLQLDGSYLSISSEAVARRDYYIGIGNEIVYAGVAYDHMVIQEGTTFAFDVQGATLEAHFLLTPFTLHPFHGVRLTPFADVGLFGFAGAYDLDAGETRGVIQYQNPPENFAVGGQADGIIGMGLPQYGGGLELRLGTEDRINLVLMGSYTICRYDGSTSFLTSSAHREKNAVIDHRNLRVRMYLEFPMRASRSLMLGVQYQQVESDASITSTATDPDVILENRERFDKDVEFRMQSVNAMLGFTF